MKIFISLLFFGIYPEIVQVSREYQDSPCSNKVKIQSSISPNGDTVNDCFLPMFEKPVSNYELKIFNRWGQSVFESTDMQECWDTKHEKKEVPEGAYFWILNFTEINGEKISCTGSVTVIR